MITSQRELDEELKELSEKQLKKDFRNVGDKLAIYNKGYQEAKEEEINFLLKVKERLKGYACGKHKELDKMIDNRIKEKP